MYDFVQKCSTFNITRMMTSCYIPHYEMDIDYGTLIVRYSCNTKKQ